MKRNVIVLLMVLLGFNAMAQGTKNFIDQNYIEVKGTAELEIVPDEIYVNIHLDEKDTRSSESIEKLEKQMFTALKRIGIDLEKQLKVSDFAGNLRNRFIKRADMKKSKDFELLVYDAKTLAKVFQELDKMKISNIRVIRVDHSEMEKFRNEVKVMAVKNGKAKAASLSEAVGQSIGRAIYINELNYSFGARRNMGMMMAKSEAAYMDVAPMPDLEFQKIRLDYTVQLRFELK